MNRTVLHGPCPLCGSAARVEIEPAERYTSGMGGNHYPGHTHVEPTCPCIEDLSDTSYRDEDEYLAEIARRAG